MAIRQGFFNSPDSQAPDRLYFAENWNDINDITFGDGYSLKKTPNQTFVTYNPAGVGEILIDIIDFAALLRGYYYVQESETIQKSLPLATQDRIDLIVLRLQGNSSANRVLSVEVIQGVEAPVPVAPPINTGAGDIWDLVLAQVYVTGGEATLPNGQSDITMVIAKMELAGFAAEATKAFQDENGRNIANNLQINSIALLSSIGISDGDLTNGDEFASFSAIYNAMPENSVFQGSVVEFGTSGTNLLSLFPESRGFYKISKITTIGSEGAEITFIVRDSTDSPLIYKATLFAIFRGWNKVITDKLTAADSAKLEGKLPSAYSKRETQSFLNDVVPTGWRRFLKFPDTDGRGSWEITIRNQGVVGTIGGIVLHVHSSNITSADFRNTITIISQNENSLFAGFRIVYEGAGDEKFLEFDNLDGSISQLIISVKPLTDESIDTRTPYEILNPSITAGSVGTNIVAELSAEDILFNVNENFYVSIDGNSASGILLEDFGAGLAVTTDVSSANATVITNKADVAKYQSVLLLVGMTNNQRTYIEIDLDTNTQTSQAFDFTRSPTIGADVWDDFQAKIFVDNPANTVEAYEARNRKWDGLSLSNASDVTFSSLRVFKVWGILR